MKIFFKMLSEDICFSNDYLLFIPSIFSLLASIVIVIFGPFTRYMLYLLFLQFLLYISTMHNNIVTSQYLTKCIALSCSLARNNLFFGIIKYTTYFSRNILIHASLYLFLSFFPSLFESSSPLYNNYRPSNPYMEYIMMNKRVILPMSYRSYHKKI